MHESVKLSNLSLTNFVYIYVRLDVFVCILYYYIRHVAPYIVNVRFSSISLALCTVRPM